MTRQGADQAILVSGLVVGGTYAIRKLIEPAATTPHTHPGSRTQAVLQIAGAEPAPAPIGQFATGYGFVFVSLAVIATFAAPLAGSMAVLVGVSNTLINGSAVFADITHQVQGETPQGKSKSGKS